MSWNDLPTAILAQSADRTRLADDNQLIQLLVADAERVWEQEMEAIRLRAAESAPLDGANVPAPERPRHRPGTRRRRAG